MLDAKGKTSKGTLPTHISDAGAKDFVFIVEYLFEKAKEKLGLAMNCVSKEFKVSFVKSIVDKLSDTIKSQEFVAILKKHNNNNKNGAIMTTETTKFVMRSCIDIILDKNQSVYKEKYINDLLEQFDKFNDPENLDKFFKIYQLLKREISSPDSSCKKRESDLTDKYYKKLIRLCNGDKKKFIDFCETTEGKILSGFEKIALAVIAIVFGYGWDLYQRVVHPSDTRGYEPYLKDEYWNENVLSQDNKNEFTGDTNKITQDYRKSRAREKTTIQTKSEQRPLSNILNKGHNNNIMIEMDELDQNGKKLKSKGERK